MQREPPIKFRLSQKEILDKMPEGLAKKRLAQEGEYNYGEHVKRLDVNQNGLDWKFSPTGASYESTIQVNPRGDAYGMLMYIFPSGHILQGVVIDRNTTGHMRQIYPDGTYYEGDWLNSSATGEGVKSVHYNQRDVDIPTFMRKIFDKEPTQIATYKGQFKNGYRHGPGVQYYPDGTQVAGTWSNDLVVCSKTQLTLSDGTVVTKSLQFVDDKNLTLAIESAVKKAAAAKQREGLQSAALEKRGLSKGMQPSSMTVTTAATKGQRESKMNL